MPKKSTKCNPRIEITLQESYFTYTHKEEIDLLRNMVPDIIRHIDGIDPRGRNIDVVDDVKDTCEFCGYKWTEDSSVFNGGCCDEDLKYESNINGN